MASPFSAASEAKSYARLARYLAGKALFSAKNCAGIAKIAPPITDQQKPEKIKRVLLPMLRHEYGREGLGDSLEYSTFLPCMKNVSHAEFFDFKGYEKEHGKAALNGHLLSIAKKGDYDLMFFALMVDDFDYSAIRAISESTPTIALNWFSDDQWRFESFSSKWAGAFNFVTTTCKEAVARYESLGYPHAIRTQWAANASECKDIAPLADAPDIAFVGQKHGSREALVRKLASSGIDVQAFGSGWKNGRVDRQKMLSLFRHAKINISPAESSFKFAPAQMKARVFEVPACGGFQLCGQVGEIYDYFKKDEEIATYSSFGELAQQLHYYLENDSERRKIQSAAHKRALAEHTYEKRFEGIFAKIESAVKSSHRN